MNGTESERPFFFNPIEESRLNYDYFGLSMQQNRYAMPALGILFEYSRPARIIEFGTYHGGLCVLLGLYGKTKNIPVYTYDIKDQIFYQDIFNFLGIRFFEKDIFAPAVKEEIKGRIMEAGRTIVLCDAIKIKEFNMYADYLKNGDVIFAHDYAHDEDDFKKMKVQKIWWHNEIMYKDIEICCRRNQLKPAFADLFRTAAWCCFVKEP